MTTTAFILVNRKVHPVAYYAGYNRHPVNGSTDGPLIATDPAQAYRFPRKDFAENLLHADARLTGFVVEEAR